jgi:hypothetical protein
MSVAMRLRPLLRTLGAVVLASSGFWLTMYLSVLVDTPGILALSPSQPEWPTYVTGGALIALHALGVIGGIGLLATKRWSRPIVVAYAAGLLGHGSFWWIRRPHLSSLAEICALAAVLVGLLWLFSRADCSRVLQQS